MVGTYIPQLFPYVPPGLGPVWPYFASFPQCWACHCILLCHFLVKTRDIACIQWSSQIVKVISKLVHVFGMIFWDGIHAKLSQGIVARFKILKQPNFFFKTDCGCQTCRALLKECQIRLVTLIFCWTTLKHSIMMVLQKFGMKIM